MSQDLRIVDLPDGYESTIARWVWSLEDTRSRTKQSLCNLSDAILDWIPFDGGNSIGTLLYHLVAIEMSYLYEDILGSGWSSELDSILPYDVRDDQGRLVVVQGESLATHINRLDSGRSLLLRVLKEIAIDDFRKARKVNGVDVTPEWILHHLMQHEAEHRGQIEMLRSWGLDSHHRNQDH